MALGQICALFLGKNWQREWVGTWFLPLLTPPLLQAFCCGWSRAGRGGGGTTAADKWQGARHCPGQILALSPDTPRAAEAPHSWTTGPAKVGTCSFISSPSPGGAWHTACARETLADGSDSSPDAAGPRHGLLGRKAGSAGPLLPGPGAAECPPPQRACAVWEGAACPDPKPLRRVPPPPPRI